MPWWNKQPKNYVGQPPRVLTDSDREGWFEAALEVKPAVPRNVETIRTEIRRVNPVRWRRIQKDIKWVQKEMKKRGLNPDEWRWLL